MGNCLGSCGGEGGGGQIGPDMQREWDGRVEHGRLFEKLGGAANWEEIAVVAKLWLS